MLNINENILLNRAGDYSTYIKGRSYYSEGRVTEIRSNFEKNYFESIVKGSSNYRVSIRFDDRGEIIFSDCTCPAYKKYTGDCKHIVATLQCIRNLDLSGKLQKKDDVESVLNIIDSYRQSYEEEKKPLNLELNYEFNLNQYYGIEGSSYLNLRIGEDRLYVVKSMKKFLEALNEGQDIEFGKHFIFSPYKHKFKDEDKEIIDFLMLLYENDEINNNGYNAYNSRSIFKAKNLLFTPFALKKFLSLMKGRSFNARIMDKNYNDITITEEEIPLDMDIQENGKDLMIKLNAEDSLIPLTSDGEYFFGYNKIYRLPKNQSKKILPLYNEIIAKGNGVLKVPDRYKESFISEVLPNVKNAVNLNIDEKVEETIYNPELRTEIYLDRQGNIVTGKVDFVYGDITINPFSSMKNNLRDKNRILLRDIEKERYILRLLEESEFKVRDGAIFMEEEEKIFDFIYDIIPRLQKHCDIYYSENFKNLKLRDSSYFSGGIRLSDTLDMLEFDFEIDGIDKGELDKVFKALKEKKKYYRLEDGSFLPLDNTDLENMGNMIEYLNISKADFEKDIISIPKFRAMYLDKYLEEKRIDFIKENVNFKKLVKDVNESGDIKYEIPKELDGILRDYQKFGFRWLKTLSRYGFGGILADDMGLGKTLQVITFLLSEKKERGSVPSLVIVPTSLVYNWEAEVEKFAVDLKVLVVAGSKEERKKLIEDIADYDIVITSYPLIRRDIELYQDFNFRYCILDEAQHIKNYNALNAKSVKSIKASNYFALTGTPMENSLMELWSIFDFLMPGYLLSNKKFAERYEKPIIKEQDSRALKDLNNHIKPFILRRIKKDVLKELPDKIEQKIVVDMTKEQKKLYLVYLNSIKGEIEKEINHKGFNRSHIKILAGLTRLRQICCHPGMFIEDYTGGSGKLDFLSEILRDAIDGGHRILLFSQFTSMLNIIKNTLEEDDIEYMYLDGSTDIRERGRLVDDFNKGIGEVFLISLKAGGTGLNLTGADTVIHFDPWWNPAVEEQATDRAHRIGQENTVQVIKLITKGTIEEKIFQLQERKKVVIDKVITEGETLVSKLSEDEILALFENI